MAVVPGPNQSRFADPTQVFQNFSNNILRGIEIRDARTQTAVDNFRTLMESDPASAAAQVQSLGFTGLKRMLPNMPDTTINALLRRAQAAQFRPATASEDLQRAQAAGLQESTTASREGRLAVQSANPFVIQEEDEYGQPSFRRATPEEAERFAKRSTSGNQLPGNVRRLSEQELAAGRQAELGGREFTDPFRDQALLASLGLEGAKLDVSSKRVALDLAMINRDALPKRLQAEYDQIINAIIAQDEATAGARLARLQETTRYIESFQRADGRPLTPDDKNAIINSIRSGNTPNPRRFKPATELETKIDEFKTALVDEFGMAPAEAERRAYDVFVRNPEMQVDLALENASLQNDLLFEQISGAKAEARKLAREAEGGMLGGLDANQWLTRVDAALDSVRQLRASDPAGFLTRTGGIEAEIEVWGWNPDLQGVVETILDSAMLPGISVEQVQANLASVVRASVQTSDIEKMSDAEIANRIVVTFTDDDYKKQKLKGESLVAAIKEKAEHNALVAGHLEQLGTLYGSVDRMPSGLRTMYDTYNEAGLISSDPAARAASAERLGTRQPPPSGGADDVPTDEDEAFAAFSETARRLEEQIEETERELEAIRKQREAIDRRTGL